jgi:hypothetical protein
MIVRFRPANISLINRRLYLPRLQLTLSLKCESKNYPTNPQILTGHSISTDELAVTRPQSRKRRPDLLDPAIPAEEFLASAVT